MKHSDAVTVSVRDVVIGLVVIGVQFAGAALSFGGAGAEPGGMRGGPFRGRTPTLAVLEWWHLALVVAVGVVLVFRTLRPRATFAASATLAGVLLALGASLAPTLVAPGIALVSLSRRTPPQVWAPWAALLIPMILAAGWGQPWLGLDTARVWSSLFFGVTIIALPVLIGLARRSHRDSLARARDEELSRVAYTERLTIAREVHDVVGHTLSMISLQSAVALRRLDDDPEQARRSLQAIRDASRGALAELRHTLGVLRDEEAGERTPLPGLAELRAVVERLRIAGQPVHLVMDAALDARVPAPLQLAVHRIVSEALTNVTRHAAGATASVLVDAAAGGLFVEVSDDGRAGVPIVEGNGVRGMRERVAALGGTFALDQPVGGGVRIRATLPWRDSVAGEGE